MNANSRTSSANSRPFASIRARASGLKRCLGRIPFAYWANRHGLMVAVAVSLTACRTIEYRHIQSDFSDAVRADNEGLPFSRQHEDVVERLTPDYIAGLDPRLRPNAWMLRAVSAWRAGLTDEADESLAAESARIGLADPNLAPGSRDQIVLAMIPALVVDLDLQRRWMASNRAVDEEAYGRDYEVGFQAALRTMRDEAESKMNERTSVDARAYYYYHRWRILMNWAAVIGTLKPPTAAFAAQDRATQFLGGATVEVAAGQERDKIPSNHALRALIREQSGE